MRFSEALLSVVMLFMVAAIPAAAESYYADVEFQALENGDVSVTGVTNHPALSEGIHSDYTSKSGGYWLLNVSAAGEFSDYVYTVMMPPGSSINYVKSSGRISIGHEGDTIKIEGVGRGDGFSLLVQYTVNPPDNSGYWWSLAIPALFTVLVFVRYRFRGRKVSRKEAHYTPSMLSERQLAIVKALERNGNPMTQRQLEDAVGLPKSSVSRNISTLVRSGVLTKHSRGMSNAVWFAEKPAKG
jgi:hypothetical protein